MRKVEDGEEKKRKEKIITFIVATNVIASRPHERQPTGTPDTRANKIFMWGGGAKLWRNITEGGEMGVQKRPK